MLTCRNIYSMKHVPNFRPDKVKRSLLYQHRTWQLKLENAKSVTVVKEFVSCLQGQRFNSKSRQGEVGQIRLQTTASPHPGVKGVLGDRQRWQL